MFNRKNQIQDMDAYVEERLSDFLDGTLDDKERQIVEAHLASSERARASYESLRYTVNLLKQAPAPALPRQFTLPVPSRATSRTSSSWLVWGLRGVAVAATAAFVLLLTTTLLRQNTPNQAFDQAAPMAAAQASPSVMIALAPTPLPTSSAQAQDDQGSMRVQPTTSPIMITVEPPPDTATAAPTTVVAAATNNKAQATQLPALPVQDALPPAAAPEEPTDSFRTELAEPTPTEIREAADATAAGSGQPPITPETLPTISEATTQRSTSVMVIQGIVTATRLRVRSGPGIGYPAIGGLGNGDPVRILGRDFDGAWLVIEYPENLETGIGWIGALFVKVELPIDSLPVYDAPEPLKSEAEPTDQTPGPTGTPDDVPTPMPSQTETPTDAPTEEQPNESGTPTELNEPTETPEP